MFIDVNCSIGNWPTRPLPITTVEQLSPHLRSEMIDVALVSSIEAALLDDPADSNRRLAEAATGYSEIIPVPVINPRHRRWEGEFTKLVEETKTPAVKVHLNYHYARLDSPEFEALLSAASDLGLAVLVPLRMEDERLSNVRLQAPAVSLPDLAQCAGKHDSLTFIALNVYRAEMRSVEFPANLYADLAFAEYNRTVENLADRPGLERLVFGTNTPFFVTRAASMKLVWADIADEQRGAIAGNRAATLLGIDSIGGTHD